MTTPSTDFQGIEGYVTQIGRLSEAYCKKKIDIDDFDESVKGLLTNLSAQAREQALQELVQSIKDARGPNGELPETKEEWEKEAITQAAWKWSYKAALARAKEETRRAVAVEACKALCPSCGRGEPQGPIGMYHDNEYKSDCRAYNLRNYFELTNADFVSVGEASGTSQAEPST